MLNFDYISIKSKIGVEYRRYALSCNDVKDFDTFHKRVESMHHLEDIPFVLLYTDSDDSLLPINNDVNLAKAIKSAKNIYVSNVRNHKHNNNNNNNINYNNNTSFGDHIDYHQEHYNSYNYNNYMYPPSLIKRPYLKIFIEKKALFIDYYNGNLNGRYKKNQNFKGFSNFISSSTSSDQNNSRPSIGAPEDFRQVSSIIDVDSVPATCRRVRIVKHGCDKPLGFYIRDGTYKRMNAHGQVELVTGVFISRLVPGGLAESTGLLAVNDEVLEVNGIQVMHGKTLDQVTDMMVANSSNLIMTIRPGRMNYIS